MNGDPMSLLVDLVIIACGVYVFYLYIDMKRTGTIRESMLLPKGINVKRCKDTAGFIRAISVKQLILGIIALVCGAAGLLQDFTHVINSVEYLLLIVVFLIYTIWYTSYVKKVVRKFW